MPEFDVDAAREKNKGKASGEVEQGPVTPAADHAPIGDAIRHFWDRDALALSIPAHRGGVGPVRPDAAAWLGDGTFRSDLGMDKGIDNRHQSWQVEPTAMDLFAEAVGADTTLFSTGGSSQNVRVAMMTVARPGETIVMARNGHKSAFAGLALSGARPVYVEPDYDDQWQVAHGVDPAVLDRALTEHPEARAALVFAPSYYGISADVAALADVAHAHGVPLITDDAWGLDHAFCSRLPPSALSCGADLTIGSVHKSLNGLGQTSVLSVQGDRIDTTRLQLLFELEQSTSASSVLLSSIDAARRQFERDGEELLGAAIDLALGLRERVDAIDGLDLMGEEVLRHPGAHALDPTHVAFDVTGLGLTGFAAADWLREHERIHLELSDHRRLMALITYADTQHNIDRFVEALHRLIDAHRGTGPLTIPDVPRPEDLRTETVVRPRDAMLGATDTVGWREAAGRVSAEMICPYPPGVPVIAPGERLTDTIVDYLQQLAAAGVTVEGAADESLATFRVTVT